MGPPAASTRWLLVAAGVLVMIAVAGLVLGGDRLADLDEDAPEATVRDFLAAHADRDGDRLRATVAADLRDACDPDEIRRALRARRSSDVRVTLVDVEEFAGRAEVEVRRVEHRGEPPFGGGDLERLEVFELAREDGAWVITRVPWGYDACPQWAR